MSIHYQLNSKFNAGKRPCPPDSLRVRKCNMVVNEASEDLLTSDVFGLLKYLDPLIWLMPLLKCAFKGRDFSDIEGMDAKIDFWRKFRAPPGTSRRESTSEIDIVIEIGSFLILIECKYLSHLQPEGARGKGRDQIIRYLDVAAFNCVKDTDEMPEIYLILLTDTKTEPPTLIRYRNHDQLAAGLTRKRPFFDYEKISRMLARNIGWVTWADLLNILKHRQSDLGQIEDKIVEDLIQYLTHKLSKVKGQYE